MNFYFTIDFLGEYNSFDKLKFVPLESMEKGMQVILKIVEMNG